MLKIYQASAGSGKTHHLTGEYINLLFRKDYLPENADHETRFDEILAVTFTNKSTAEMKARIVKEISRLSIDPTSSHYYESVRTIGKKVVMSDQQIKEKARRFLNDILNNYSDFQVSTIDSFFQKIVRSFARELNIQSNYEVELNVERILSTAISRFLQKLDQPQHKRLFNWMLKFSEKKIEDGGGWHLETDLYNLVKSVMNSEEYKLRREAIKRITDDKDFLSKYTKRMHELIASTQKCLREIGEEGINTLHDAGFLTSDFSGKSNSAFRIFEEWQKGVIKEPTKTFESWAESEERWYTRGNTRRLPAEHSAHMMALLEMVIKFKNEGLFIYYNSAKAILDNIYQLGILADIDNEINEVCNDNGIMFISTTTELLNNLINVDDAPFIYEKTGTRIHSFMIDEFQDTSLMQWKNFRPLIENSLGNSRINLIVGDVKQSIYRWRGGDWSLLHNGLNDFSEKKNFTLSTNHRSQREIISFNNKFFTYAAQQLANIYGDTNITDIFKEVWQNTPKDKEQNNDTPGAVQVNFIDVGESEKGESSRTKFERMALDRVPEAVMQLQDAGFHAKDIAILCRENKQCKKVAEVLLAAANSQREALQSADSATHRYVFDIISNEALGLSSRHVIRTILSILRFIQKPSSHILRTIASCQFLQQKGMSEDEAVRTHFSGNKEIDLFLEFSNRPLYDMLEGIISRLPDVSRDIAYVQAFRDCVIEFANTKKSDIEAFLEWWQQREENLFISTPENQDAIRIMTIHKSKGLGMPAVILPFVQGTTDIENKGGILWCKPDKEPFCEGGIVVPVQCKKDLEKTIFAKDFQAERLRVIVDKLNTLYVAFTRPKEAMIIFTPKSTAKSKSEMLDTLLSGFVGMEKDQAKNPAPDVFRFGDFSRKKDFEKDYETGAIAISQPANDALTLRKIPRLALKHDRLIKDIDAIERGNCIHEALSVIEDYENIDAPIDALYSTGRLTDEYFLCEEMKAELHRLLSHPDVRPWFRPGLRILNERTIVGSLNASPDTIHRPDRIVIDGTSAIIIDYKTGEHQRSHFRQVRAYKSLLASMGFTKTTAFLWYTNPHKILEVK